jgi:membrane dipeptidase
MPVRQGAGAPTPLPSPALDPVVWRRAEALVQQHTVIDVHAHDPGKPPSSIFPPQVTMTLMVKGKVGGLVQMVPFSPLASEHPADIILADLRRLRSELEKDGRLMLALGSADLARGRDAGRPAVMLGVEYFWGLLEGRLDTLDAYYREGVRVIGLAHGGDDLVTEGEGTSRRLTAFGHRTIAAMNDRGIACDVTHLPDAIRREAIAASRAPILVSHSAAYSLVPSAFNVDDETLDRLAANRGLIGVSFCSEQLSRETLAQKAQIQNPMQLPPARAEEVVDQIDYLRKRLGLAAVAIGSDFGGSGRMAPSGLQTIEGLPLLAYHMLRRGYSEQEVTKVLGGNFVDFMRRVEGAAKLR